MPPCPHTHPYSVAMLPHPFWPHIPKSLMCPVYNSNCFQNESELKGEILGFFVAICENASGNRHFDLCLFLQVLRAQSTTFYVVYSTFFSSSSEFNVVTGIVFFLSPPCLLFIKHCQGTDSR